MYRTYALLTLAMVLKMRRVAGTVVLGAETSSAACRKSAEKMEASQVFALFLRFYER